MPATLSACARTHIGRTLDLAWPEHPIYAITACVWAWVCAVAGVETVTATIVARTARPARMELVVMRTLRLLTGRTILAERLRSHGSQVPFAHPSGDSDTTLGGENSEPLRASRRLDA